VVLGSNNVCRRARGNPKIVRTGHPSLTDGARERGKRVVVVPVVGTHELHDLILAGVRTSESHRKEGGLRTIGAEFHGFSPWCAPNDFFSESDRGFIHRIEVGSLLSLGNERLG